MNLEKAIKYSGYTAAGLYVLIGFIVSFEVISRYIFNAPTIWVNEISRLLQIWATYLALTYTFHNKEFIRITVFYDKANDKTKKVLDFISFIFIIYFSSLFRSVLLLSTRTTTRIKLQELLILTNEINILSRSSYLVTTTFSIALSKFVLLDAIDS